MRESERERDVGGENCQSRYVHVTRMVLYASASITALLLVWWRVHELGEFRLSQTAGVVATGRHLVDRPDVQVIGLLVLCVHVV